MKKRLVAAVAASVLGAGLIATGAGPVSANTACTYTQGYYKTHAGTVVIGRNDLTAALAAGLTAKTGLSLQGILDAPVQGNANLIAGKQVIAAALNGAPGEAGFTGAVGTAFYSLADYFEGRVTLTRDQIVAYAATLDAYNNGLLGVPHCG